MTTTNGRSTDSRRSGRSVGQWLLGLLIVLALVSSVLMVFTDQLSLPGSIAVIAALWAAVIGAILVTKFRRQAESAEAKSRDLRLVYELQLEREISARRQYELDVEATIRKEVNEEANAELGELKKQVLALRSSLEMLLGEPLPDARVALPNEKLRELASGLGGPGGGPYHGPVNGGSYVNGYDYQRPDDSVLAARDFAATAPAPAPTESSRRPREDVDPNELTEVIPVVRDDDPISGRIATEVPVTPPADDTVDVEEVATEEAAASEDFDKVEDVEEVHTPPTAEVPEPPRVAEPAPAPMPAHRPAEPVATSPQPAPTPATAGGPPAGGYVDDTPTDSWMAHAGSGRRHRREPEDDHDSAHSAGLPVSELLSQLRQSGVPGGGRRRRND